MTAFCRSLAVLCFATSLQAGRQSSTHSDAPRAAAIPVDAVEAILTAFRTHAVVALGDAHGNEQLHAVRLSLIRDARFAAAVNDIVVEFGNARHQDLVDRFVGGAEVPDEALRRVWQDTTQLGAVWDRPIYEEFFRAVRAVNANLPRKRQLRIVLGDPPVDWSLGPADAGRWTPLRRQHAADAIARQVLAKDRRALVIYGSTHLSRWRKSIVGIVEDRLTKVFSVTPLVNRTLESSTSIQPDIGSWPTPSVAAVQDTMLDTQELGYFDAVLYLGRSLSTSRIPPALCGDPSYVRMRVQRLAMAGRHAIDRFRAECGLSGSVADGQRQGF